MSMLGGNTLLGGPKTLATSSDLQLLGVLSLDSVITPPVIVATAHNYSPAGWSTAIIARVSSTGLQTITGFSAPSPARAVVRVISNVGSSNLTLANDDAGSLAANRMRFAGSAILMPNQTITLWYDAVSSRWRRLGRG